MTVVLVQPLHNLTGNDNIKWYNLEFVVALKEDIDFVSTVEGLEQLV